MHVFHFNESFKLVNQWFVIFTFFLLRIKGTIRRSEAHSYCSLIIFNVL